MTEPPWPMLAKVGDREHGRQRAAHRPPSQAHARLWWLAVGMAGAGAAYSAALFAHGVVPLPSGSGALMPDVPIGFGLMAFLTASVVTAGLHEVAHVLVARDCGIETALRLGRRAWWLVLHTRMPGIWSLPGRLRWRPIAAGLVADAVVVSAACTGMAVLDAGSTAWYASRVVLTVTLVRVLWQCQWYLHTDLYYLILVASESIDLRRLGLSFLRAVARRARSDDVDDVPAAERAAAVAYLASLPVAFAATAFVVGWMLLPFARAVLVAIGQPAAR